MAHFTFAETVQAVAALGSVLAALAAMKAARSADAAVKTASEQVDLVRDQVAAERGQLDLAQRSLQATIRPIIVLNGIPRMTRIGESGTYEAYNVSVTFWNIGAGAGFIESVELLRREGSTLPVVPNRTVPVKGTTSVPIAVTLEQDGRADCELTMAYTDVDGQQRTKTTVNLVFTRGATAIVNIMNQSVSTFDDAGRRRSLGES